MRIKEILVPVDFSECASNAMHYAAKLAQKFEAKMMLLHVAGSPVKDDPMVFKKYKTEKLNELEHIMDLDPAFANIITEVKIDHKSLKDAIDTLTKQFSFGLIVMGTEGVHDAIEEQLGTTTYNTLKESKIPLSIVPNGVKYKEPTKIGFATDLKDIEHSSVMDVLLDFIYAFNAELDIFHIKQPEAVEQQEEYLKMKALDEYFAGIGHAFYEVDNENIIEGIESFIHSNDIDMLAVLPHKHSFFEKITHQSITKNIIQHPGLPILAFHE